MAEVKCDCEFADHALHERLLALEDGFDAVALAVELIWVDHGMTVDEFRRYVDQHNWRQPALVYHLVKSVEIVEGFHLEVRSRDSPARP